ncbi:conserved hypothetical protein [Shewanella sp. ANA-3]|uniref:hypothetical protein n=1 Tax=Shewanella sp. (strain ANA-3) TaxID=94122 RepID=UPI00005DCBBE|nr:hypothetical protein [Shewanella sp. ANA-3]ABK49375.1 conserved hypothetical protein [Shewanella sp. ANA-3]
MSNSTLSSEEEAIRQEVSAWYHKQALEMPPERLDQDILRLSQARLAEMNVSQLKPVATPVWRRFPWALSSAASLVLVVGLVILNRGYFEEELVTPAALTMSAPMPAQAQLDNAAHQAKVEEAATQNRQREAMRAQAKMSAQENQQVESRTAPQIARALPQPDQAVIPRDEALMASLTRLQALIEAKQSQEASALAQTLLKQYPELAKSDTEPVSVDAKMIAKFKELQQQLSELNP